MKKVYLLFLAGLVISGCSIFKPKPKPSPFMIKGAVEKEGLFGVREYRYDMKSDLPCSISYTLFRIENKEKIVMKTQKMNITGATAGELVVGSRRDEDKAAFDFSINPGDNALLTGSITQIDQQQFNISDPTVPTITRSAFSDFRPLALKKENIVFSYIYSKIDDIESVSIPEYAKNLKESDYKDMTGVFLIITVSQ